MVIFRVPSSRLPRLLALAALLGLAGLARAQEPDTSPPSSGPATPPQRTLRVTGEGRASAPPDVALVTLGVTALDPSLEKANRDATARARKVVEVLKSAVAPADLQTSRFDVQMERSYDPKAPPKVTGYRVSNHLRARVRDLGKVGPLIDRALAAGANEVEGLQLVRDDPREEEARALSIAVKAARSKAEEMARAAGVQLGEILTLTESGEEPGRPVAFRAMAMKESAGAVPVEAGEVESVARVELVFAIR